MKISRWPLSLFVFLTTQAVYLTTLNPAFPNDDSAETITAGVTLGIQHPPSYALAALIGRLQSFWLLGGFMFRASWGASLWASLAAVLLTLLLWETLELFTVSKSSWIKVLCTVVGGLSLGLSPTYWQNALSAKGGIYHLSLCFQLLILLLWMRVEKEKKSLGTVLPITLFLVGLSLAGHWETMAIFVPAGLLLFILGKDVQRKDWVKGIGFFLLGLSPLLYLPLRAKLYPVLNLGAPENLSYFWADLSRSYYSSQEVGFIHVFWDALTGKVSWDQISPFIQKVIQQTIFFADHCETDLGWLFLLLSLVGLWRWWQSGERRLFWFLIGSLVLLLGSLFSFLSMPNDWIGAKFLLSLHWMVFLWGSLGAAWVLDLLRERYKVATVLAGLVLVGSLGLNLAAHWKPYDQSRELLTYDYGVDVLKALPSKAIFFAETDQDFFSLYYLQQVEHRRLDVVMIPTFTLFEPWGAEQVERKQPELGLTASKASFPDHFARMIYATSEIVVKNRDHRPIGFSGFNGAFHLYYLNRQKNVPIKLSGMVWLLERPLSHGLWVLSPSQLRIRGFEEGFTSLDGALGGLRKVYLLLGNGK